MLGKIYTDAKLRMGSTLREWKEKREEQKAQKQAAAAVHSEHGHGRFFLLTVPATATICAAIVEVYWAILFCIEATGRLDWNFDLASAWNEPLAFAWNFAFNGNAPVLIGLLAATAPIVMISMVWLPVQFAMRGHGAWRRGSLIAAGLLCNAIVIISGTVVMNHNRQEQVRGTLAIEQQAQQNVRGLEARRDQIQGRLDTLTETSNTTLQAQAARAGAVGWDEYISTARRQAQEGTITPSRLALIERARGSAVAAETYQTQIDELTAQIASAPTAAEVAPTVEDTVGQGMNAFSEQVKVYRPPLIAVACTIIGILGAWWTLAMLMHMNPRDVLRSGWADEGHRIEDLREQEAIVPQPMKPAREVVTDSETGEELIRITPKPHWRKQKGKKQRVETNPDIPPDETGVPQDGGNRTAVTLAGEMELPASDGGNQLDDTNKANYHGQDNNDGAFGGVSVLAHVPAAPDAERTDDGLQQQSEIHLDLSEELPVFEDEPNTQTQDQEQDQREPETDPARLIAAE